MKIYIEANTNLKDIIVDEITLDLANGDEMKIEWSCADFSIEKGKYSARYKDVTYDNEFRTTQIESIHKAIFAEVVVGEMNGVERDDTIFEITGFCIGDYAFTPEQLKDYRIQ